MRKLPTKEVEYEEAPSGYVKLYNYKEPFMKFTGGHGYQGVLLFDGDSDKIQCHLCGKWFDALSSHIMREHNIRASEYKEMVGLFQSTALINEKVREKLIATGTHRFKNLRKGKKRTKEEIEKTRATLKKNALLIERQNIYGTCPAQLIERIQAEYQLLGHTPRTDTHANKLTGIEKESAYRIGDASTYSAVFGSWKNALEMANVPYRKPGVTVRSEKSKWTYDKAVEFYVHFININNRNPVYKEIPNSLYSYFSKNKNVSKKEIIKEAWSKSSVTKGEKDERYSKDQLIKFLVNFKETHGREPSYSDAKRGLIPHLSRYSYHFGSWKKAIKEAFGSINLKSE